MTVYGSIIFVLTKEQLMNGLKLVKAVKSVDKMHYGIFAAGILFGTAGLKILSSSDAKGVYTKCLAAGLRAKDCVMKTVTKVQESADDILAEAKQINEERAAAEEECTIAEDIDMFDMDIEEEAEVSEDAE